MCKQLPLIVLLFAICSAQLFHHHVVHQVYGALDKNLDYLIVNYDKINEDCLFGIFLAKEFLLDIPPTEAHAMEISLMPLTEKIDILFEWSSKYLQTHHRQSWISDLLIQPRIWRRNISFKYHSLDERFIPDKFMILNLIKSSEEAVQYGNFSDRCLENLLEITRDLKEKRCELDATCENKLINDEDIEPGYFATHRLLYLQTANQRKCTMRNDTYERKVRSVCNFILTELRNIEYYKYTERTFDLILEQIVLCGSEGFTEFLQLHWLTMILMGQKDSGCFPAYYIPEQNYRYKRNINEWNDGCADHTTGLGTAVLSLYMNYLLKAN